MPHIVHSQRHTQQCSQRRWTLVQSEARQCPTGSVVAVFIHRNHMLHTFSSTEHVCFFFVSKRNRNPHVLFVCMRTIQHRSAAVAVVGMMLPAEHQYCGRHVTEEQFSSMATAVELVGADQKIALLGTQQIAVFDP